MSLQTYRRKRDFKQTDEPRGQRAKGTARRFVIQKHAATRLHYDFRLEIGGTLKSWAVPKGIPFQKGEKRLAVEVEDHPVSYIKFEGVIPRGQYGGGTVMVWDRGNFRSHDPKPLKSLKEGKLHFTLSGTKLHGDWYLVRIKKEKEWLLIKADSDVPPVSEKLDDTSALSGKSMSELATGRSIWQAKPLSSAQRSITPISGRNTKSAEAMPKFVPPMLARPTGTVPNGDWMFELKFDGYRALILKSGRHVQLLSRTGKDLALKFPEVVETARQLDADKVIVDGEIVALDEKGHSSFQLLQGHDSGSARPPIFYFAFDLIYLDGKNWKSHPVDERKRALEGLFPVRASVHPVDERKRALERVLPEKGILRFSPSLGGDGKMLMEEVREHGLEGLIGKRTGSTYEPGRRSGAWVKLKVNSEQEVVIGGYTEGEGARSHFGALLVGVNRRGKLHFVGKVGTGFDARGLKSLKEKLDALTHGTCPFVNLPEKRSGRYGQGITRTIMKRCHWVKPQLVCQVKFQEWTRDGKLRQPVFLGLRDDKSPKEVSREA